ncbi:MAG TPA: hypothetical protein ENJ37_06575 [Deltaproteobacteria bacterium]|nr:hypothetical protein [Deltaproteobacteria bacterium]
MKLRKGMIAILAAAVVALGGTGPVEAGGLMSWLKSMIARFDSHSRGKSRHSTSVAGVKGAPETVDDDLYWKGPLSDTEINAFMEAISYIENGDNETAARKLETFVNDYPDSPLAADAREGLRLLRSSL